MQENIQAPLELVFQIAQQALNELNLRIHSIDNEAKLVEASKKTSLFSFGEDITIKLESTSDNTTMIFISSQSKFPQIIDWGTNADNKIAIINQIKMIIENNEIIRQ
jgi:hypothetical protein